MFKLQACSDVFVPALKLLEGFHEDNLKAPVLHISLCLHQKDATVKQFTKSSNKFLFERQKSFRHFYNSIPVHLGNQIKHLKNHQRSKILFEGPKISDNFITIPEHPGQDRFPYKV